MTTHHLKPSAQEVARREEEKGREGREGEEMSGEQGEGEESRFLTKCQCESSSLKDPLMGKLHCTVEVSKLFHEFISCKLVFVIEFPKSNQ